MTTEGIEGIYVETHNWGKTCAFWQSLGFRLEFATDHGSGQLCHPDGGPYVFVAERPAGHRLTTHPILRVADSARFAPPPDAEVTTPFTPQHWGVVELFLDDPDGRPLSFQAPLPEGVAAPPRHG